MPVGQAGNSETETGMPTGNIGPVTLPGTNNERWEVHGINNITHEWCLMYGGNEQAARMIFDSWTRLFSPVDYSRVILLSPTGSR